MLSVLKAIGNFFARIFSRAFAERLLAGIETAAPYLVVAYEFSKIAAAMTPNRTDDEILRLAEHLGVPALLYPGEDRGVLIGRIIFRALKLRFGDAPDRVLNRAIEIAYGAVKP